MRFNKLYKIGRGTETKTVVRRGCWQGRNGGGGIIRHSTKNECHDANDSDGEGRVTSRNTYYSRRVRTNLEKSNHFLYVFLPNSVYPALRAALIGYCTATTIAAFPRPPSKYGHV